MTLHDTTCLFVVCCIDNDLVEDLIEARNESTISLNKLFGLAIEDPHGLSLLFYRADISVGAK